MRRIDEVGEQFVWWTIVAACVFLMLVCAGIIK
jgi:hypothetical protein